MPVKEWRFLVQSLHYGTMPSYVCTKTVINHAVTDMIMIGDSALPAKNNKVVANFDLADLDTGGTIYDLDERICEGFTT